MGNVEITTDRARVDVEVVYRYLSESSYWAQESARRSGGRHSCTES